MIKEWNSLAEDWDKTMKEGDWFQRYIIYPELVKLCGVVEGKAIIDVGCGNGHLSRFFRTLGAKVMGVDSSQYMVEKCCSHESDIDFACVDITEPVTIERTFDFAVFNNSLQDMPHFEKGIKNTCDLLENQGQLLIVVKHPCFHPKSVDLGWKIHTKDGRELMTGSGLTHLALNETDYTGEYFMMDDYLVGDEHVREWFGKKTTSYARTLQDYINTIIDCGFVLKGIYEPAPIVEGKEENESLYELLTRIPNFIFIQAIKQER